MRALAGIEGVYVPSMYDVVYEGEHLVSVTPKYRDVPERVEKRTVADLADWPYPKNQLVPLTEVVHDRLNVEVFRGCTRGCRFCQAGMITRPVRERPATQVRHMIDAGLRRTGYDEVALTSLSTADFSGIESVVAETVGCGDNVSVSLPSLRVDAFTVGIASQLKRARRTERGVQLKWHDPAATLAEGIASRGDRRLGAVIESVWRQGGVFQEWSEHFDLRRWESAMAEHGLSIDWYAYRHRTEDEVLP